MGHSEHLRYLLGCIRHYEDGGWVPALSKSRIAAIESQCVKSIPRRNISMNNYAVGREDIQKGFSEPSKISQLLSLPYSRRFGVRQDSEKHT